VAAKALIEYGVSFLQDLSDLRQGLCSPFRLPRVGMYRSRFLHYLHLPNVCTSVEKKTVLVQVGDCERETVIGKVISKNAAYFDPLGQIPTS
jgi:hypothetical protein